MWPNISLNCLPSDHLSIGSYLKNREEEKDKRTTKTLPPNLKAMDSKTKIDAPIKKLPEFPDLTKEEIADNCKYLLEILPKLAEHTDESKPNKDSFIDKLYSNFAKYICNSCKSKLDNRMPNPVEKVQFALNKIVEMQAEDGTLVKNSLAGCQNDTECSQDDFSTIFCVDYRCLNEEDDFQPLNEPNGYGNDKSAVSSEKSVDAGDNYLDIERCNLANGQRTLSGHIDSEIPISFGSPLRQSSPKKTDDEISFTFKFGSLSIPSSEEENCDDKSESIASSYSTNVSPNKDENRINIHVRQFCVVDLQNVPSKDNQKVENALNEVSFESSSDGSSLSEKDSSTSSLIVAICDVSSDDIEFANTSNDSIVSVSDRTDRASDSSDDDDDSGSEYSDDEWDEDDSEVDLSCGDFNLGCGGGLMLCNLITTQPTFEPVEDEYSKLLKEANRKWEQKADLDWAQPTPMKVNFLDVVTINEWDDTEETRNCPWMQVGLNRMRFNKRIEEVESEIGWIFDKAHRDKVYISCLESVDI